MNDSTRGVRVCALAELPPGSRRVATLGSEEVAIFNVDGELFAIANECPHRGGPLGMGDLVGHVLHCPLHAWSFDLRTGAGVSPRGARVRRHAIRVEQGEVFLAHGGEP